MASNSIKLLTGNSHPQLAKLVADRYCPIPHNNGHGFVNFPSRLGIELTKIMVLQYSNQETSVTIGESVRDEDGTPSPSPPPSSHTPPLTPHLQYSSSNPPPPATSTTASWNSSSSSTPAAPPPRGASPL